MEVMWLHSIIISAWQLYNKERAYLLTIENQDDTELSQERKVYPDVFSELLTYILGTKTSSDNAVVFRLADQLSN